MTPYTNVIIAYVYFKMHLCCDGLVQVLTEYWIATH